MKGFKRMVWTIGGTLAVTYVALLVALYVFQGRLLFMGTPDLYRTPAANGWNYDDVALDIDGEATRGWFVHAEGTARGVVLFSHGNAGNMADRLESVALLRDLGFDVLVYDYGGYGESEGNPSETRCYADARTMWRYLTDEREIPPSRIVLFGRSLGAAVTCQLATEVDPAGVVLESAYRSVPAMAQRLYRIFPGKLLARHVFDNESKIGAISSPLLFVHSPQDEIIPYAHGRRLYETATGPKSFLEIHGGHNDGFWMSGALYTDGLGAFLDSVIEVGEGPSASRVGL